MVHVPIPEPTDAADLVIRPTPKGRIYKAIFGFVETRRVCDATDAVWSEVRPTFEHRDALLAACMHAEYRLSHLGLVGSDIGLGALLRQIRDAIANAQSGTGTTATSQPTERPAAQYDVLGFMKPYQRHGFAYDPTANPALLDILSKDDDWYIRETVALNPNTSAETLSRLANDSAECVAARAKEALAARGGAA